MLLAPTRMAPVVAMQAWVGVGSADEPPSRAGIAHVFEHMLFKGTERRGVGEIARTVEGAGGDINAWTSFDETVYHLTLASRFFDTGVDVLADALRHSTFDPGELDRERQVILEEIRQSEDDPGRNVAQAMFSTVFREHPYGRPVIGDADRIRAMRRSHLLDFFHRWYVAENVTLVIAGDFDSDAALRTVADRFADMPGPSPRRRRRRLPRQSAPRGVVLAQDVNEAYLALGFPIPALTDPDAPALDVAAIALGQGDSSRLARKLRRERELVAAIYGYAHSLREHGLFAVGAVLRPGKLRAAVAAACAELYQMGEVEIDSVEIDKARHAIVAEAIYGRETVEGVARVCGYFEAAAGDAAYQDEYLARVRAVTAADVRDAVARHLRPDRMTVAALVPPRGKHKSEGAREALRDRLLEAAAGAAERAKRPRRAAKAAPAGAGDIACATLSGGARVLVLADRSEPIVAMRAVWPGGLRLETPARNGIGNLLAGVVTRGAGPWSADEIIDRVDAIAGSVGAVSGRNSFAVRGTWLTANWEEGLELVSACALAPHLDEEEVEREKRRVHDDLQSRHDDAGFVAFRLFAETLYRKHPYRMDLVGTDLSVDSLTPKALRRFHRRAYPPSAAVISVVGDVDVGRALDLAERHFGTPAPRAPMHRKAPQERFDGRSASARRVVREMDRRQAHLVVGFPGTTLEDPDRHALDVIATLLGGQGGRLFVELRDREGLAYRVGARSMDGVDPGYMAAYIACAPAKLEVAEAGLRREIERVKRERITAAELRRIKRHLVGTHELSLQRRGAVAAALSYHEAYGLGHDYFRRYPELVAAVTQADVARVAARFLDWDRAVTAIVRPPAADEEGDR